MSRIVSEAYDAEVASSTRHDKIIASVWRGGILLVPALNITSYSLSWDSTREIEGQGTLTVRDRSGLLSPWALSDPLGPGGSRVHLTFISGTSGTRIPLGKWRIREAVPSDAFRWYDSVSKWASSGSEIDLSIDDDWSSTAKLERMDAETVRTSSCLSEVTRLLQGNAAVAPHPDVVDRIVPSSVTYDEDRLSAIHDHLARIRAAARASGDGTVEVVPMTGAGHQWVIAGGKRGVLIRVSRRLSDSGVYNQFVSTGEAPDGRQLVARAPIDYGELAFGGPFGRVPMWHKSVATDDDGVLADALTVRSSRATGSETEVDVECVAHYGVQTHDPVLLRAPTAAGEVDIPGRVVSLTLKSAGSTPSKRMNMSVAVDVDRLAEVSQRLRGVS